VVLPDLSETKRPGRESSFGLTHHRSLNFCISARSVLQGSGQVLRRSEGVLRHNRQEGRCQGKEGMLRHGQVLRVNSKP
jgi:hypothetical protein